MVESNTDVSSTERDHAVVALGVHFREGRLSPEEFESRCALAHTVVEHHELNGLFKDLPEPHFDSVLSSARTDTRTESPVEAHRYRNILDQPIFNTSITHRKFRVIGWILAVLWIPLFGELLGVLLPSFLVVGAAFTPILLMIAYTIAIQPLKPKYKYMEPDPSKHRILR